MIEKSSRCGPRRVVPVARSAERVFAQPAHPYTQGLLAARPRLGLVRGTRLATIPGRVPELHEMPPGCAFADRCPHVQAACRAAPAPVVEVAPGHASRCVLAGELK